MPGYNYSKGMSNNAVDAYHRNQKPISRITAADLQSAGAKVTLEFAKWLARNNYWRPAEWHHSSKFYNRVNFYDTADLTSFIQSASEQKISDLKRNHAASKPTREPVEKSQTYVRGQYMVWPESRRKSPIWEPFTGILDEKGWIHLPNGRRKKANAKGIRHEASTPEENQRLEDAADAKRQPRKTAEPAPVHAGDPCRQCRTPCIELPTRPPVKPSQTTYSAWYLRCPNTACNLPFTSKAADRIVLTDRTAANCDNPVDPRCQCPRCSDRNRLPEPAHR